MARGTPVSVRWCGMMGCMDALTQSFVNQANTFSALLTNAGNWQAPSPCVGWTAADVLDHVISSQRGALETRGILVPDLPETSNPGEIWNAHMAFLLSVLDDEDLTTATYDSQFGPSTLAAILATFMRFDLIVHGWDITRSWGRPSQLSDGEMDQVEALADQMGPALYAEGVCTAAVLVPETADRQTAVLGRLGRQS